MNKIYKEFSEVEADVKMNAPEVVYKVRTWGSDLHKSLLKDRKLWFSHPFDLNDELDARPPYEFDQEEVDSEEFYQRLVNGAPDWTALGVSTQEEFDERCLLQWNKIKSNPKAHFDANRAEIMKREKFDPIGILSTTIDGLNAKTWTMYGDNFNGYAVGFNTVELSREMDCSIGKVNYSDKPYPYKFLAGVDNKVDEFRYKKEKWQHEDEFRFLTVRIGNGFERLREYSPAAVAEVILGHNLSPDNEKDILSIVAANFPASVRIFKTAIDANGKITKIPIALTEKV